MNNAKLWLVVSPNVGIPVFLGAVAVSSFAVHVGIVANTSWISDYHSGVPLGTGDMEAAGLLPETDAETSQASFALPNAEGGIEVTIILPDGTPAKAILQPSEIHASSPGAPPAIVAQ